MVSGNSRPVSRVKTGNGSRFCFGQVHHHQPAPWKLVPMAAALPNRSQAQARISSVRCCIESLVQLSDLRSDVTAVTRWPCKSCD